MCVYVYLYIMYIIFLYMLFSCWDFRVLTMYDSKTSKNYQHLHLENEEPHGFFAAVKTNR